MLCTDLVLVDLVETWSQVPELRFAQRCILGGDDQKKSGSQIRKQGLNFALRVQLWKSAHPSFQPPAESFWACLRAALDPVTNQLPLCCLKLPLKSPEEDEEEKQEVRRLAESKESSAGAGVEAVLSELDGFFFHVKRSTTSGTEGFYLRTTFWFVCFTINSDW